MTREQRRARVEIVLAMQQAGGQKTFVVGEVPGEVFRYLAGLEADGIIEQVRSHDPLELTYRLNSKNLKRWRGGHPEQ